MDIPLSANFIPVKTQRELERELKRYSELKDALTTSITLANAGETTEKIKSEIAERKRIKQKIDTELSLFEDKPENAERIAKAKQRKQLLAQKAAVNANVNADPLPKVDNPNIERVRINISNRDKANKPTSNELNISKDKTLKLGSRKVILDQDGLNTGLRTIDYSPGFIDLLTKDSSNIDYNDVNEDDWEKYANALIDVKWVPPSKVSNKVKELGKYLSQQLDSGDANVESMIKEIFSNRNKAKQVFNQNILDRVFPKPVKANNNNVVANPGGDEGVVGQGASEALIIPRKPYRLVAVDGGVLKFGKLFIEPNEFMRGRLVAVDERGKVMLKSKFDPSFFELLTKRYNPKMVYTDRAINLFRRLVDKSGAPMQPLSGKHKLLTPKKFAGEGMIYDTVDGVVSRLNTLIGSIAAGNNANTLVKEAMTILDYLLNKGELKPAEHKKIYNKFLRPILE